MRYVPETVNLTAGADGARSDLAARFVAAVEAAVDETPAVSPEREFLGNWHQPEDAWKTAFAQRIERYFERLHAVAETADGFDGWVQLAESRRRAFRLRPLAEFRLTTPTTNIDPNAPLLAMGDGGIIVTPGP